VDVPLPWERLLWSGRPSPLATPRVWRERYLLTDFRVVRTGSMGTDEIPVQDISEVHRHLSRRDRLLGSSTIEVRPRDRRRSPLLLRHIRRGAQVAALLELLAGDPGARIDADAALATLAWQPREPSAGYAEALAAIAVVLVAIFGVAIGLHGKSAAIAYPYDDAIYPGGKKQSHEAILQFMKDDVMPWARAALGPLKGGPDRIGCETCHGRDAAARDWQMPGVAALPEPDVKDRGWERYSGGMDAQMRNAIYGYLAQPEKQSRAGYMREVVMPGMARLLRRPAYDFTRSYAYNRRHAAFGCYHCHKVK
jgi:hypothetical protein